MSLLILDGGRDGLVHIFSLVPGNTGFWSNQGKRAIDVNHGIELLRQMNLERRVRKHSADRLFAQQVKEVTEVGFAEERFNAVGQRTTNYLTLRGLS